MALCSFGGVSDQFGAISWAAHETGMVPNLLPCEIDMTEWLKDKYKESGASGARGRPGHTKATGDSKYQLGIIQTHKRLFSLPTGLLLLNKYHDILRYCRLKLFVCEHKPFFCYIRVFVVLIKALLRAIVR